MGTIHVTSRVYAFLLRLLFRFEHLGRGVRIHPSCDIRRSAAPHIHIADDVYLDRDVWLNVPAEASLPRQGEPLLRIGEGTAIGRRCTISAIRHIEIGPKVLFAPGVLAMDHAHEFADPHVPISEQGVSEPGRIIIEEGCWLGHSSVVVTHRGRDLRIGRNSVIGANAVVTRSIPPYSLAVGLPARVIRRYSRETNRWEPVDTPKA